ncbi:MAG: hypothetical protein HHAS10_02970 [Candidatus Altimarinota bacterium]
MGYGDYTPSSSGKSKPLTKKQLEKAKRAYEKADLIAQKVKDAEKKESNDAENTLRELDIF